jgi:hypothetical protein
MHLGRAFADADGEDSADAGGASRSTSERGNDLKAKMFFKSAKIAVIVQQRVAAVDARSRDQAINCAADRDSTFS